MRALLTKNAEKISLAKRYTDATMTYEISDGSYAFADGRGRYFRKAIVMVPGYDFVYGEAEASAYYDDAHEALDPNNDVAFPTGSVIRFRDEV